MYISVLYISLYRRLPAGGDLPLDHVGGFMFTDDLWYYRVHTLLRVSGLGGSALQVGRSRVRFPTVALLRPKQPLKEMNAGNIFWGVKAAGV